MCVCFFVIQQYKISVIPYYLTIVSLFFLQCWMFWLYEDAKLKKKHISAFDLRDPLNLFHSSCVS